MKRPLNKEEKELTEKGIKRVQDELDYLSYLEQHAKIMLDKGLELNFKKQLREYKDQYEQIISDIKHANQKIETMKDHLKKGVEVKKVEEVKNPAVP
jgi:hypothetical protein